MCVLFIFHIISVLFFDYSIDVQMSMLRKEADQRTAALQEAEKLKRHLSSYRNNVKLARFQSAGTLSTTIIIIIVSTSFDD
jgi:hypothetical protein